MINANASPIRRALLLVLGQLVRKDGDEDQIVDAENDLECDQVSKASQAAGSIAR